jgi:hypothetical protein
MKLPIPLELNTGTTVSLPSGVDISTNMKQKETENILPQAPASE